jgi:hypothetical protein
MDYEPLASAAGDRASLLSYLAHASVYGNLGLFIGSGFSKAVVNEPFPDTALSWGQLLTRAAGHFRLNPSSLLQEGMSYPALASGIARAISTKRKIPLGLATAMLKDQIAQVTSWYADKSQRERFSPSLEEIAPAWVITTNYDLVFESLLPGRCVALGPDQIPSVRKGYLAVYHLHGVRSNPPSLVVTEEDYVRLFRPSDYRQTKLATLLKESVTLMLGYGLGDVNVLTAMDWATNVFSEAKGNYPQGVVQLVRDPNLHEPTKEDGLVLVGGSEIASFLADLAEAVRKERERTKKKNEDLAKKTRLFEIDDLAKVFLDDKKKRTTVLKAFKRAEDELLVVFLAFLDRVIALAWERSEAAGAFEAYAQQLEVLVDLLVEVDSARSPALFRVLADALSRLAPYVGTTKGKSWAAANIWKSRKKDIPAKVLNDLMGYVGTNFVSPNLLFLLKNLVP